MTSHNSTSVNLWLAVFSPDARGGWSSWQRLWTRAVEMQHLPPVGAQFAILYSEDEPDGSVLHTVKNVYWMFDGTANIEFTPFQLDPIPEAESLVDGRYRAGWWSSDGDLEAQLTACGWTEYGS